MNTGRINNSTEGRGLDRYFELFSKQKVNHTLENTSRLLDKHIALGAGGAAGITAWSLKSLLGMKSLSFLIIPALVTTVLLTSFYSSSDTVQSTSEPVSKLENQFVQNDLPLMVSSDADEDKTIAIDSEITEEKNVEVIIAPSFVQPEKLNNNGIDILLAEAVLNEKALTNSYQNISDEYIDPAGSIDWGFNNDGLKTLFNDVVYSQGYYISPIFKSTNINSVGAVLVGGKLGWTMNSELGVGITGFGLTNNVTDPTTKQYLQMGYGGIYFEYINSSDDLIHFTLNSTFGFGGFDFANYEFENQLGTPWGVFMVIEPEANVELNISKQFRLGLSASYRYTDIFKNNNNYKISPGIGQPKLDGLSWGFYFKYGIF